MKCQGHSRRQPRLGHRREAASKKPEADISVEPTLMEREGKEKESRIWAKRQPDREGAELKVYRIILLFSKSLA
jgi:hypothetical protein